MATPAPVFMQWSGQHGGGDAPGMRVLRTAGEWTAFWQQARREPPRALDAAREMAVAIGLGQKPTGGYEVEILGAREQDGALVVEYRESAPAPDMMVTQALTTPWSIALVARSTLPVKWQRIGPPASAVRQR